MNRNSPSDRCWKIVDIQEAHNIPDFEAVFDRWWGHPQWLQIKLLMIWYPDQSHTNPTAKYAHHSNRTTPTHVPQKPNQINLLVIWNQNRTEPHHTKPYSSSQTNELPRAFGASMDRTARGASGCSPSPSFCSYRERIGSSGLKSRPNRPNLIFQ